MNELTGHGLVGLAARNHAQDLGARAASADEYDPKGRSMLQSNSALLVAAMRSEWPQRSLITVTSAAAAHAVGATLAFSQASHPARVDVG